MAISYSGLLDQARAAMARERAAILAGLAVISALLSNFASMESVQIFQLAGANYATTPLLPGLYFGVVLCAGIYLWVSRNTFNIIAVLIVTAVAWVLAHKTAIGIFHYHETLAQQIQGQAAAQFDAALNQYRDLLANSVPPDKMPDIAKLSINATYPFTLVVAGLIAGLVGSAITAFGVSIASPEFRTVENWTRTLLIGTIAGVLLQYGNFTPLDGVSIMLVILVWQPAVAASIGYGLSKTAARAKG